MADWFVRKGGSANNGGSSPSLTPDRSGTDLASTSGSTQVTSASAAFTAGDVGKGLNIAGISYRIATYTNATTVQLDRNAVTTASGRAWAIGGAFSTVNKPISGLTVTQSGDNIYIGAGVYREILVVGASNTGSPVTFIGDVDGLHTGDAGEVQISAYLTSDKAGPSGSILVNLASFNYWAFRNITFVGGNANPKLVNITDATNITFTDCAFIALTSTNASALAISPTTQAAHAILFDRCRILALGTMTVTLPTFASGADYDYGLTFRNCIIDVSGQISINFSGGLAVLGGGVYFYQCLITVAATVSMLRIGATGTAFTYPVKVENSLVLAGSIGSAAFVSTVLGAMTEDYNIIVAGTPRTLVAVGAHSISNGSCAPLFHFGQEKVWGGPARPYGMPTAGSGLLGFGSSGAGSSVDILNVARPAGGASPLYSVGPYERSNTWVTEATTTQSGTNPLSVTGPGYHDFYVPVISGLTHTISMYMRYDSTYAGTRPQLAIRNSTALGVADQTITATVAALNAWEQQSTASFVPTANGVVTVRLYSSDTNGGGKAYADTFAMTAV